MKAIWCRVSILGSIASICVLASVPIAHAAPVIFFGEDLAPGRVVPAGGFAETARNEFLSALGGSALTEDFESFTDSDSPPFGLSFEGLLGNASATLPSANAFICDQTSNCSPPSDGEYPTSGDRWVATDGTLLITFDAPIAAFGFFGTDIGDRDALLTLALSNGGPPTLIVPHTVGNPAEGNVLFFGFIDPMNTYTNVSLVYTPGPGARDFFGFDDMIVGASVPEPSVSLLLAVGLAVGWWRRSS